MAANRPLPRRISASAEHQRLPAAVAGSIRAIRRTLSRPAPRAQISTASTVEIKTIGCNWTGMPVLNPWAARPGEDRREGRATSTTPVICHTTVAASDQVDAPTARSSVKAFRLLHREDQEEETDHHDADHEGQTRKMPKLWPIESMPGMSATASARVYAVVPGTCCWTAAAALAAS